MLSLVVTSGTGEAAQVGDELIWGKTGTTENYGDAWFVGSNEQLTVAVWVGYADKVQPMEYEYAGSPVAGGTYPATIFSDFMSAWVELRAARGLDKDEEDGTVPVPTGSYVAPPSEDTAPAAPETPEEAAPEDEPEAAPVPEAPSEPPAPETPAPVEPAPVPAPPPDSGGTGGGVTPEGGTP
jgi:penicillin-binding protein 1A